MAEHGLKDSYNVLVSYCYFWCRQIGFTSQTGWHTFTACHKPAPSLQICFWFICNIVILLVQPCWSKHDMSFLFGRGIPPSIFWRVRPFLIWINCQTLSGKFVILGYMYIKLIWLDFALSLVRLNSLRLFNDQPIWYRGGETSDLSLIPVIVLCTMK